MGWMGWDGMDGTEISKVSFKNLHTLLVYCGDRPEQPPPRNSPPLNKSKFQIIQIDHLEQPPPQELDFTLQI